MPFMTTPQAFAKAAYKAAGRGRGTVYIPAIWRLVMVIIRSLPERILRKLKV